MKNINVIIVDDEKLIRLNLYKMLAKYCPYISHIHMAQSAEKAREILINQTIDIMFLDIAMPKESGFELLKSLKKINFSIVFISAYNHYGIKAIKANALDYILKPIDTQELITAVKKAIKQIVVVNKIENVNNLINQLENPQSEQEFLTIPFRGKYLKIKTSNITYFKASNNYCLIYLEGNKSHVVTKTLKEIGNILSESKCFLRIHKSYLVNMNKVRSFYKENGLYVCLVSDVKLPISRRKQHQFMIYLS